MDVCAGRIGGIAQLHGEKCNIVANFSAADLHFRGHVRRLAAENRPAGWIRRRGGFAWFIEKHEAFHQGDAGRRRHAGKCFPVASREKAHKLGLILSASG